ncbi:hypothetical protein V8E51_013015 [Hyaloscypha variabilis]
MNDRTITMASNIRLIPGDQLRELDDATIFQILSPGYFYSADLFRSSLRLEPTYCPPCRRFLHNPAPMFRQWWVDEADGGMRMPTQWHEIHSMKELQACAALADEGPKANALLRDHPDAHVRLSLIENFRQPANNMLYQTQKIFIDFGFPDHLRCRLGQLRPSEESPQSEWPSGAETGFLRLLLLLRSPTSSDDSYELAKYWLRNCCTNNRKAHNFCIDAAAKAATRPLPTRLIDVNAWPLLCIQDSTADWQAEAGRMADIYSKAVLTLAAAASKDANSGLFTTRKALPRHIVLDDQADPSDPDPITVVQPDWDEHFLSVVDGNLQTRGWTFQERALSTRILHYGDGSLAWECATLSASELCQWKMPRCGDIYSRSDMKTVWDPTKPMLNDPTDKRYVMQAPDVFVQWFGFVEEYSSRSLTYRSDKLVAISGVAKALRRQLGENHEYHAGLWGEHWFMLCLGWVSKLSYEEHNMIEEGISTESSEIDDSKTYIAPSWSWASLDGPIIYPFRKKDTMYEELKITVTATIKSHHLEHSSGDDTTNVESGASITLSCPTWHAFLIPTPLEEQPVSNATAWHRDLFYPFWKLRSRDDDRLLDHPIDIVLDRPPPTSNTQQTSPRPVMCLLTVVYQEQCPVTRLVGNHKKDTAQLVIVEECRENQGKYRRVGVAFVVNLPEEVDWFIDLGGDWGEVIIV